MLDTFELAIAHSVNPNPDLAKRPLALVISDSEGNLHHPGVSSTSVKPTRQETSSAQFSRRSTPRRSAFAWGTIFCERTRLEWPKL